METQEQIHKRALDSTATTTLATASTAWLVGLGHGFTTWIHSGVRDQSFRTASRWALRSIPLGVGLGWGIHVIGDRHFYDSL